MKKSKKGPSKVYSTDVTFMERTGELQRLRDEFPNVIEQMIRLLTGANRDCENHLHEFAFNFSGIAHLYGRRFNSPFANNRISVLEIHPEYLRNQNERRDKLEKTTHLLSGLITDIDQLDLYHLMKFYSSYLVSTNRNKVDEFYQLHTEIQLATHIIMACQKAYSSTFKAAPKGKGRRPLPYVEATRELINLWTRLTGTKVPSSKTFKGQITTNAGEFVRLGMSIIDSGTTTANVVTAINNALSKTHSAKYGKDPSSRPSKKMVNKRVI